jgi:pyrimidine operon attenuation protein/uracil phosphoribosyltransferase
MTQLMTQAELDAALDGLAAAICAQRPPDGRLVVVGIRRRGATLADRLVARLAAHGCPPAATGALDITLYRDDLSTIGPQAVVRQTEIDFDITGTWLVLVDDVIYTGRSIRAALDALMDLGRPQAVKLAALIDRGWRELPIQPDFVGRLVTTTAQQIVKVKVAEIDGTDEVVLDERDGE